MSADEPRLVVAMFTPSPMLITTRLRHWRIMLRTLDSLPSFRFPRAAFRPEIRNMRGTGMSVKDRMPTISNVIVVLGASIDRDGSPGPTLIRRAEHGVALTRQGAATVLLLAGGNGEAEAMRYLALEAGVAESAILLERSSRNTFENAREVARIAREHGWDHMMLVTDPWHMPRARMLFELAGLRVAPASCDWAGSWTTRGLAIAREVLATPRSAVRAMRFLLSTE